MTGIKKTEIEILRGTENDMLVHVHSISLLLIFFIFILPHR